MNIIPFVFLNNVYKLHKICTFTLPPKQPPTAHPCTHLPLQQKMFVVRNLVPPDRTDGKPPAYCRSFCSPLHLRNASHSNNNKNNNSTYTNSQKSKTFLKNYISRKQKRIKNQGILCNYNNNNKTSIIQRIKPQTNAFLLLTICLSVCLSDKKQQLFSLFFNSLGLNSYLEDKNQPL